MKLQLRSKMSDADAEALNGARLTRGQLGLVTASGDVDAYKPDGEPLIIMRRGAISRALTDAALPTLQFIGQHYKSNNRGKYAGLQRGARRHPDGTMSTSSWTMDEDGKQVAVRSVVVGFFTRSGGWQPFCRATAFTRTETEKWSELQPMIQRAAEVYRAAAPVRYRAQADVAAGVHPDWIIPGTPFSTLTVNNNVLGSVHKDKGDSKVGMGVISVVRRGSYAGAVLGFPQYGIGAELHDGDVILFNPHEWHGVTPFEGELSEDHERISIVYYLRAKMVDCGSAAEELARAKAHGVPGMPTHDAEAQATDDDDD